MKSHPRAGLVLATVILLATSGCFLVAVGAAGAAGAGTVAYVRGELDATLGSSFPAVAYATEKAVSQLQFAPGRETKDALTLEIATRTADDKKLDVIVTSEASNLTTVRIRIGLFGNEGESRAILDKIQSNL